MGPLLVVFASLTVYLSLASSKGESSLSKEFNPVLSPGECEMNGHKDLGHGELLALRKIKQWKKAC